MHVTQFFCKRTRAFTLLLIYLNSIHTQLLPIRCLIKFGSIAAQKPLSLLSWYLDTTAYFGARKGPSQNIIIWRNIGRVI